MAGIEFILIITIIFITAYAIMRFYRNASSIGKKMGVVTLHKPTLDDMRVFRELGYRLSHDESYGILGMHGAKNR